jgi:hypothetical protein
VAPDFRRQRRSSNNQLDRPLGVTGEEIHMSKNRIAADDDTAIVVATFLIVLVIYLMFA